MYKLLLVVAQLANAYECTNGNKSVVLTLIPNTTYTKVVTKYWNQQLYKRVYDAKGNQLQGTTRIDHVGTGLIVDGTLYEDCK